MSTQAKLQPDPLDQLKTMLEDAPRSYGFLSDYVRAAEWCQPEEDIFSNLTFENSGGGVFPRRHGSVDADVLSRLYESLDARNKLEVRVWWHEMVRGKASRFQDLKSRLSKLGLE
jgi:hypothetical protein